MVWCGEGDGEMATLVVWELSSVGSGDRRRRIVFGVAHKIYDLWWRRHGGSGE
jgi:hypothetical protein